MLLTAALLLPALAGGSTSAHPAWQLPSGPKLQPADYPDDPLFAGCESQDPVSGCTDNEAWQFYGPLVGDTCLAPGGSTADQPHPDGGLPCWARNATDPEHAAGVNITGAWAQGNEGSPKIVVAYIEGGVNYSNNGVKDALDNIYLNKGELPYPENAAGQDQGTYDLDGNGRFDIRDYVHDPRVNPECPGATSPFAKFEEGTTRSCLSDGQHDYLNSVDINSTETPYLSPEDLIAVFGHCRISDGELGNCPDGGRFDNDGNGYPNDVSGWNTQRNTNDPQTDDQDYSHAPGLIGDLGGEFGNGYAAEGVCARCRVMPIKQGAEAIGRSDQLAPAILYATDAGAKVISSVVVSYTYTSFAREAVDYAYRHGVALSMDSNDFDSTDHTDGMLYDHALPGNSLTQDPGGAATQTFRQRSNVTSYGTHNVFSGEGNSTSGATPFQAGMLAMVQSAAVQAKAAGKIPRLLTPDEIKQTMMDTASPVIPQTQTPSLTGQWPGNPDSHTNATHTNWSAQYGYGRPNIGAATHLVLAGRVPPSVTLSSPHWFAYVDPQRQATLPIRGDITPSAWRSKGVRWTLEWALGPNPGDSDFKTVSKGKGSKHGLLGKLDLSQIPHSYAAKSPGSTLPPDGTEQYAVTLRVRAVDGNGLKAEDRRTFNARHDPKLLKGFPKSIGTELSAAPSYADVEGRRQQDLVYGTYDGTVDALRPNGGEVPGFPVSTRPIRAIDPTEPQNYPAKSYESNAGLRDARDPVSGVAVGDLDGDGRLDVVATTSNAYVYAWDQDGKLLKGFPVHSKSKFASLPVPTPRSGTRHGRLPSRGNLSAPVLADLQGNGRLDVLMSAYDGYEYAWKPNGKPVPGWPVKVQLPSSYLSGSGPTDYIHDTKLISGAAVGDVAGTGTPQVFVPSTECLNTSGHHTFVYGIWPDGNNHAGGPYMPGWPVSLSSIGGCYDQSIDFVEEGSTPPAIGDLDGTGTLRVLTGAVTGAPVALNANGSVFKSLSPGCASSDCQAMPPYYSGDPLVIGLTGQAALGDILGSGSPSYVQSVAGATSLPGALDATKAELPQVYEDAWDVASGSPVSGFPRLQDGFPFFVAPLVVPLSSGNERAVVDSNDSGWIHAYLPSGGEAPGFPKFTGQWPSFSGVLGDAGDDGHDRFAYGTREGSLFVWMVKGSARRNDQWWHYHHDERNSSLYGSDTRRPAVVGKLIARRHHGKTHVAWRAPGDDGVEGKADKYEVYVSKHPIDPDHVSRATRVRGPKPGSSGSREALVVAKAGLRYVAVRSIDDAGNVSALRVTRVR